MSLFKNKSNSYPTAVYALLAVTILALACSWLPTAVQADPALWSQNGANVYYTGGNVGIGTNNPNLINLSSYRVQTIMGSAVSGTSGGGLLELASQLPNAAGADVGALQFIFNTNTASTAKKRVGLIYSTTEGVTANDRGGNLRFYTKPDAGNLTERMRIDSRGRIGIGTGAGTLTSELTLVGDSGANMTEFSIYDTSGTTAGFQIRYDDATGATYLDNRYNSADGDLYIRTKTAGTAVNALFVESGGNVGIGTTAPTEKLDVNGNLKLNGNIVSDGDICIGACQ